MSLHIIFVIVVEMIWDKLILNVFIIIMFTYKTRMAF